MGDTPSTVTTTRAPCGAKNRTKHIKKCEAKLNNQCLIVWTNNLCKAQIGQTTELCWNWSILKTCLSQIGKNIWFEKRRVQQFWRRNEIFGLRMRRRLMNEWEENYCY